MDWCCAWRRCDTPFWCVKHWEWKPENELHTWATRRSFEEPWQRWSKKWWWNLYRRVNSWNHKMKNSLVKLRDVQFFRVGGEERDRQIIGEWELLKKQVPNRKEPRGTSPLIEAGMEKCDYPYCICSSLASIAALQTPPCLRPLMRIGCCVLRSYMCRYGASGWSRLGGVHNTARREGDSTAKSLAQRAVDEVAFRIETGRGGGPGGDPHLGVPHRPSGRHGWWSDVI